MSMQPLSQTKGLISLVARHPNAANLLMVLMLLFGAFALGRINTQFFPTIETDSINVSIAWSGASAEDVETNILQIVEPSVRFLDGVKTMHAYAREGSGTVALEFEPGTDMQKAIGDVESAVKAISNLPEEAEAAKVSRSSFFDRVGRISIAGDVPEATLRIYAKKIRDDLIARGIDKVSLSGLRSPELKIDIPERDLRRIGMSAQEVSNQITKNSRDLPSGQSEGQVEKQLRAIADFKTPEGMGNIEIRSFATGEKVQLKDIADIRYDFKSTDRQGLSNGQNAIELTVQRAPSADTLKTAAILNDYVEEIKDGLPPGIVLQIYDVRAEHLIQRIWLLVKNGLGGLVLVVATLFIFLNARIAFWVAAGIPVAMLTTIGLMLLFGQTINMISLFALIMMLGIIVDDAIVVGEHTATRFSAGDDPYKAAEIGAGRMMVPVLAALTTTIASFAPILLIGDVMGQIMGVMPIVVIATVIASLIECFFILPGHLAHTLQPRQKQIWSFRRHLLVSFGIGALLILLSLRSTGGQDSLGLVKLLATGQQGMGPLLFVGIITIVALVIGGVIEALINFFVRREQKDQASDGSDRLENENRLRRAFDAGFARFRDGPFNRLVQLSFAFRYLTVSIAIAIFIVVFGGLYVLGGRIQFNFFPVVEAENINARLVFNVGVPQDRVRQIVAEFEQSLVRTEQELTDGKEKLVTAVFTTLGSAGRNVGDNLANFRVQLTSSEERTIRTSTIVNAWRRNLPKLPDLRRASISSPRGGPPGRDIDLELSGHDVAMLKRAAEAVIPLVSALPSAAGVADDLPYGKPEVVMRLTERGKSLGFSIDEVGRQVRAGFEGLIPRRFALGDDEITVRVKSISPFEGAAALRNLELKSPAGEFVPLSQIVSMSDRQGFSSIRRQDGKTIVSVTTDLDTDIITTEQAVEALKKSGLDNVLSQFGVEYEFGGRNRERAEAMKDLRLGIMVALVVIYIILAWVFSSYWRPIAIMLIIPFGIVGAIFGHFVLGFKLSILSFIALLGLAGILVNDSIILVSRLDERLAEGQNIEQAAVGASRDRLRAVLLTSLTTIGGLFPLMFEKSVQAQFILPMAISIIFGLALTTLLVLFLVPAFIGIGEDIGKALRLIFGAPDQTPHSDVKKFGNSPAE